jgi:hypothetical protein
MTKNSREDIKKIFKGVVALSVGFTVNQLIKANTPVTKTHQKVYVFIAAYVLADLVANKASAAAGRSFDRIASNYDKTFKN